MAVPVHRRIEPLSQCLVVLHETTKLRSSLNNCIACNFNTTKLNILYKRQIYGTNQKILDNLGLLNIAKDWRLLSGFYCIVHVCPKILGAKMFT